MLLTFPRGTGREDELYKHPNHLKSEALLPGTHQDLKSALRPQLDAFLSKSGLQANTWYEITGDLYGGEVSSFHSAVREEAFGRALTVEEGFALAEWVSFGCDKLKGGVHHLTYGKYHGTSRKSIFMSFEKCVLEGGGPSGQQPPLPDFENLPKNKKPTNAPKVKHLLILGHFFEANYKSWQPTTATGTSRARMAEAPACVKLAKKFKLQEEATSSATAPSMASVLEELVRLPLNSSLGSKYEGVGVSRGRNGAVILCTHACPSDYPERAQQKRPRPSPIEKEISFKLSAKGDAGAIEHITATVSVYELQILGPEYLSLAEATGAEYEDGGVGGERGLILRTLEQCEALVHEVQQAQVCEGTDMEIDRRKWAAAIMLNAARICAMECKQMHVMGRYVEGVEVDKDKQGGEAGPEPLQLEPGVYGAYQRRGDKYFLRGSTCTILFRDQEGKVVKKGKAGMVGARVCEGCQLVERRMRGRWESEEREDDGLDFADIAELMF